MRNKRYERVERKSSRRDDGAVGVDRSGARHVATDVDAESLSRDMRDSCRAERRLVGAYMFAAGVATCALVVSWLGSLWPALLGWPAGLVVVLGGVTMIGLRVRWRRARRRRRRVHDRAVSYASVCERLIRNTE